MKLLDRLTIACRTMNFAPATEACYRHWVEDYLHYHRNQAGRWVHPDQLREEAVEFYLTHLAVGRELSASSQSQALCALVFLYGRVLQQPLGELCAVRAKRPVRLPTVLSVDEVRRVLNEMRVHPVHGLIGQLLYGGGLRVSEGCELRVMDIDFDRRQLMIRCAKGWKDRAVPLPVKSMDSLAHHLEGLRQTHRAALARGAEYGWAPVPTSVEHKRPQVGQEWGWQYAFPSAVTRLNAQRPRRERWHISPASISAAVKEASERAGIRNGYRRHLVNSVSDRRRKSLTGMDSSAKRSEFGENG